MNSLSRASSKMRVTGLSGFDTENTVAQLMKAERIPLDSLKQKRTLLEWKQESYRNVSSSLKGFKTKFFDVVNRASYLLGDSSVKPMAAKSSNSDYVSATASPDAAAGTQSIKVIKVATADSTVSSGKVSSDIKGSFEGLNHRDKKILVSLDGTTKEITFGDYVDEADMANQLQASLDQAFGADKLKASVSFDAASSKYNLSLGTINGATKVTVYNSTNGSGTLESLGIAPGATNRITLSRSLESLKDSFATPLVFAEDGTIEFTINGKIFSASKTDTLGQLFDRINNSSEANAKISYDEITDKITLTSKQTGAGDNLKLGTSKGNFFEALKLGTITDGVDAEVLINGTQTLTRSTNSFTVNGVNYSIKKAHDSASAGETITVEQDTDTVIKNIKSFIEEYNKLIDSINTKTTEKYNRDYLPLTDEQKEAMDEKTVEKWETKAKTGLLRNDDILQKITLDMRKAVYEKIEGVGISLKDLGIESRSFKDNGKLYLEDENKLKSMLQNNPDEVAKLLNGVSENNPSYSRNMTKEQREDRYENSGIFQRLSDIIEDNITTARDADGRKGILLEKAGIEGDLSNTKNFITEELFRYDDRIDILSDKLDKKETNYYLKFANLEKMLSKMNQQSSWLSSQFGGK